MHELSTTTLTFSIRHRAITDGGSSSRSAAHAATLSHK